jgi:hypothetical protein
MGRDVTNLTFAERDWWGRFFKVLGETGIVTHAAKAAKVSRETVYLYRNNSAEFARRWAEAMELGNEMLEDVARQRALKGSDRLLQFMLTHNKPERYNPPFMQQVQMDVSKLSDEELRARIAELEGGVLSPPGDEDDDADD